MSNYFNPVKIIKTNNWQSELNKSIKNLKISAPIIVTTPGNRNRLSLDSKFDPQSIFSDFGSNPNFEDCINVIEFCQKNIFDGVIALGGGSAMDLAKVVVAHLCLGKSDIYELIEYKEKFPRTIPSIFLPTTHGTASEVTMWGTIWNMKEKKKYSISHPSLYPNIAILDGNLTMSLPLDISITTVMDALSHSFEAIWNVNSNQFSSDLAIEAISIILQNVNRLKKNPSDKLARKKLLNASNKAGLAFSNTKTAAAHSISYPLTIHFGIPHGIASSITILELLNINKKSINPVIDKLLKINMISYDQLISKIKSIPIGVVPFSLSEWGVKEEDLDLIVDHSFTSDRIENNIIKLSKNDIINILHEVY
jgi:alcohol dehydrogenase class IV